MEDRADLDGVGQRHRQRRGGSGTGRRAGPVACTRKNAPGTKALSIKAIQAGGAIAHRLGLSETLLVFAEHRLFLDEPPSATIARLRNRQPEKKIVVEVVSADEALTWAHAGADVLQLEKFTPAALTACRARLEAEGLRPVLVAAGGVRVENAADYVTAGAAMIATSAPYHAAPPRCAGAILQRRHRAIASGLKARRSSDRHRPGTCGIDAAPEPQSRLGMPHAVFLQTVYPYGRRGQTNPAYYRCHSGSGRHVFPGRTGRIALLIRSCLFGDEEQAAYRPHA